MKHSRTTQFIAMAVMGGALAVSGVLATTLGVSAGRHRLAYTDTAEEGDPPQVALGIAMGAFRGVFVNFLWIRAHELKEAGKFFEAVELSEAITTLQPRFPRVWAFHAWNLAYNISVTTQTPEERWQWVQAGIRLLRNEGIEWNPNDLLLYKELGWIYLHKIQGITDDSNVYYKKQMAEEWTVILGPPPPPGPETREREAAIEAYASWLRGIADAPETVRGCIERVPEVEVVLSLIERTVGEEKPMDLLRRYTIHSELHRLGMDHEALEQLDPRYREFARIIHTEGLEEAWEVYISHVRKRVLIDEYNMDPTRMIRYTRLYGPIDWRHPAAHGIYWARTGVERAADRTTEANVKDFDFLNTDRVVLQSIQEMFRSGEIYFDFFEEARGEYAYYIAAPNVHFIDAYHDMIEEAADRAGLFEDREKRIFTSYAAGYENFVSDAILFLFRRGQLERAEEYRTKLVNWEGRNRNDWTQDEKYLLPLSEYVREEMIDRYTAPSLFVNQVVGSIQGALVSGLLAGDVDLYRSQIDYAKQFFDYFRSQQIRQVRAGGSDARMGMLPTDFRVLAGGVLAQFMRSLPLDRRRELYLQADNDLRLFAYMQMERDLQRAMGPEQFNEMFPPPAGIEAFRVEYEAQRRERQESGNFETDLN